MSGNALYRSFRDPVSGTWQPEGVIYEDPTFTHFIGQFSAGSVNTSDSATQGIAAVLDNNINFFKNGPPFSPVVIAPPPGTAYSFHTLLWENASGSFFYQGRYFLFVIKSSGGHIYLACLSSADGGLTWSELDSSNSPLITNDINPYWDGTTSLVTNLVQTPSAGWSLFTFDMSSGVLAWSSPFGTVTDFPILINAASKGQTVVYANGDIGVFYNGNLGGTGLKSYYRLYSVGSASWGSQIVIRPSPSFFANLIMDTANDLVHTFTYAANNPTSQVSYFQVTHAGSIGSTLFTFPTPIGNGFGTSDGVNYGSIWNGIMILPYDDWHDAANAVWECPVGGPYTFVKKLLPVDLAFETAAFASLGEPIAPSCAMIFYGVPPPPGVGFNPIFVIPDRIKRRNAPGH